MRALRVEAYCEVSGLNAIAIDCEIGTEHILQSLQETVDRTCVQPFAVDKRLIDESVIGTIDQCVSIEEKKLFHCNRRYFGVNGS